MKRIFIHILILLIMTDVVAQHQSEQTFLDFKVSNDFIFGTDHYFTNGLQLRIYDNFISNISKELFKAVSGNISAEV